MILSFTLFNPSFLWWNLWPYYYQRLQSFYNLYFKYPILQSPLLSFQLTPLVPSNPITLWTPSFPRPTIIISWFYRITTVPQLFYLHVPLYPAKIPLSIIYILNYNPGYVRLFTCWKWVDKNKALLTSVISSEPGNEQSYIYFYSEVHLYTKRHLLMF